MIKTEEINEKTVKLYSSLKTGRVQEIISGRVHKEVYCAKGAEGNFCEIRINK